MGLWETLTQGQGTPWGPTQTGRPDTPNMVSPWDVQGMDQTGQWNSMQQKIAQGAEQAGENSNANLLKAGIAGGADSARAAERIGGAQAQDLAQAQAQLQQQDYNQRMGLAQMMNQAALQKYGIDASNYNAEQQGRNDFWNKMAGTAGTAAAMKFL